MCYSPIIYLLLYLPQYFSIHKRGGDSYGLVQDTRLGCSSTVAVLLQLRITAAYCYFSFFASSCRTRGGWVGLSGGYCGPRTSRQHPLMREYMMGLNTYPPTKENMWWYTSYTVFTFLWWGHTCTHIDTRIMEDLGIFLVLFKGPF